MIGNTIEFLYYPHDQYSVEFLISRPDVRDQKPEKLTGLVIDAFTDISGSVTGKSSSLFGFGDGSVRGSTKSKRKYKVQFYESWDSEKKDFEY